MKSLTRTSTTSLPSISGTNSSKIHEFYEKLVNSVQSLETLGKLKEVNGYARNWEFPQLIEALRKWMERNSAKVDEKKHEKDPPEKLKQGKSYQTRQQEWKSRPCVYCESANHKSSKCDKVTDIAERKKYLVSSNCASTALARNTEPHIAEASLGAKIAIRGITHRCVRKNRNRYL